MTVSYHQTSSMRAMVLCLGGILMGALPACAEQPQATDTAVQQAQQTQQTQQTQITQTPQGSAQRASDTANQSTPPLSAGHLRLKDDLDRPQDGYCLDILGSGDYIRFDMPMSAHNCKPGLYADEAVVLEPTGHIRFPAYEACATVAGINDTVLAGTAVMPKGCNERSPFLESQYLQHFVHRGDGRMELKGSGLCITVGQESASTFDASHRWRALFMAHCEQAPLSHSQWHFVVPTQ